MSTAPTIGFSTTGEMKSSLRIHTPGRLFLLGKRCSDMLLALLALILLSPLLLFCASWIYLMDGGPILYKQWRVGRNGWLFKIWKFRTMVQNAEVKGVQWASKNDPRVLRGCQWMRKSHVDELPQLFNILIGQMSLVGPRPERPEIFVQLSHDLPEIEWRLITRPGLTGLAQVRNGYTNDIRSMRRKLAYDIRYLRRRSLIRDIKLMFATLPRLWDSTAC